MNGMPLLKSNYLAKARAMKNSTQANNTPAPQPASSNRTSEFHNQASQHLGYSNQSTLNSMVQ